MAENLVSNMTLIRIVTILRCFPKNCFDVDVDRSILAYQTWFTAIFTGSGIFPS